VKLQLTVEVDDIDTFENTRILLGMLAELIRSKIISYKMEVDA